MRSGLVKMGRRIICLLVITTIITTQVQPKEVEHKPCDVYTIRSDNKTDVLADCSYRGLNAVPENLPANITCLNFVGNNIIKLKGTNWEKYIQLKKLSLAGNEIEHLQGEDFRGLDGLEMLDLSLNYIRYTNISHNAFIHLKALEYLDLKQNLSGFANNEHYPYVALLSLTRLQTLMIDGLPEMYLLILGSPFISEIYFSGEYGRCNILHLSRLFFKTFRKVQKLYMAKCAIKTVEKCAFDALPYLSSLDLSNNTDLGFDASVDISCGLNASQTIKQLNLNSLTDIYYGMCSSISTDLAKSVQNTSLELLTVENNNIVRMEDTSAYYMPSTLKYLSISGNMFMYGKYIAEIVKENAFKNILYFDTSRMFALNNKPNIPFLWSKSEIWRESKVVNPSSFSCDTMFTRKQRKDYFEVIRERVHEYRFQSIQNESDDNVSSVKYLDLSSNQPNTFEMVFKLFEHEPYLKFLNASNNYLGYPLLDGKPLFQNLSRLEILDVSNSRLTHLHFKVFTNLTSLKELYLSSNKIKNISFDMSSLKRLSYLDLKSNRLENVPEYARTSLDALTKIKINLSDNPLKCNCLNENFLRWLESKLLSNQLEDSNDTTCMFTNDTQLPVTRINYDQFYRECLPPQSSTLILVTSLGLFAFLIIVSWGLVYRYKWNLRYLYYMTKFKLIGGYQPMDNTQYEKDVFISYANEDRGFVRECIVSELEVKAGLRLLVHDRDFRAGEFVADNIVRAITSTRWTLAILTGSYIRSKWCMYELNMARMEATDTGRTLLCVVLKEDIPVKHLPLEVIDIIKKKTYLEFPDEEEHLAGFWERLRATLSCAAQ